MKDQLEWEQECVNRSKQAYLDRQAKTREHGTELTDACSYVLRDRLIEIGEHIKEDCKKGSRGLNAAYNKLVRQLAGEEEDYTKVGYICLQYLLIYLARSTKVKVTKFVSVIGTKMEAEMKCAMFEAEYPAYFHTVMRSMKEQGVSSAVHKQKTMMKKFNDFDLDWTPWTTQMKVHVGTRVFRNVLKVMDDVVFLQKKFYSGKTDFFIDTTDNFDKWVNEFESARGIMHPQFLPLKIPPVPWENQNSGAYYSPALRLPFIKTRNKRGRDFIKKHPPLQHYRAVNKMQRTEWKINEKVLDVQAQIFQQNLSIGMPSSQPVEMSKFPYHLELVDKPDLTDDQKEEIAHWKQLRKRQYDDERKRKGRVISFRQSHLLAQEIRTWDKLYFAYNCDFRGRVYCATTGLSPQGADDAKGLLKFAKGVKLGKDGIKWLAVQGANTFGADKLSYADRVKWVEEREDMIRGIVEHPLDNREWGEADKPYQFLAFCFEWAEADYGRNPEAVGHIAVGLDGSCNGLQHFSAMLRDEVGAKATNLLNCDKPEDIYGEVALVTTKKLQELADGGCGLAQVWLQVGVTRKCAKRPVMTLPYGATMQSARDYVFEYVLENWTSFNLPEKEQWEMTKYLTPILWESIGEVVIAARAAMAWLQKNVGTEFCQWTTILGFPVHQHYLIENIVEVCTFLEGNVKLYTPDMNKGIAYKAGHRNGIAPNFVHSVDSSHMILSINAVDLHSYAMIHDDFGTHAGNTERLFKTIRRTFKYMYSKTDPIRHWAKQMGVSTAGLPRGNYDIEEITKANYFFG